ncbi:unnamed protein product [Kuraishia capsulata CBS 1993]|uniref:Bola-like protein n=1 Tax=Kuraishia capsulata CBS 1993 TaxID=1382522 RepID=W6MVU5_9ASCO|nr:uncharacterized protein KUCA_T00002517001 [Kuraishia capsulata CBS 1993]CDK26545.1 unnamed protein product [Kuraishia capsulata CBS 1993]
MSSLLRLGLQNVIGSRIPTLPKIFNINTRTARWYSADMDDYERKIYNILYEQFHPKVLQVKDVSGGCGSMFAIQVESEAFKGIPMIKQHRLVNQVLKDEIAQWHGLQLRTKAA